MRDLRVDLSDGGRIQVRRQVAEVLNERAGEWRLVLSLEEARELAEALDVVATSAPVDPGSQQDDDDPIGDAGAEALHRLRGLESMDRLLSSSIRSYVQPSSCT